MAGRIEHLVTMLSFSKLELKQIIMIVILVLDDLLHEYASVVSLMNTNIYIYMKHMMPVMTCFH